jgi:hypothetical protein
MTQYRTYLDDSTQAGQETILGIQQNGSEFGVGVSTDIICNNISAGIITASQINGTFIGISTLSVNYSFTAGVSTYATSAGISTYATTSGISTTSQGLTGTPDIAVGIITANSYSIAGNTSVYAGAIGVSTVDSSTTGVHYITYDTTSSAVNISNFTSGKKFEIIARNSSGGNRNLIIRTSTTASGHSAIAIGGPGAYVTNGTITIASGSISYINVFNINGTIIGSYTA